MRKICGDFVIIDGFRYIENACVFFENTIIKVSKYSRENIEKGRLIIISHGLASTHTHLGLYPIRDSVLLSRNLDEWVVKFAWPWEKYLLKNRNLSYYSSLLAIYELLQNGVTAFADMHFNEDFVAEAVTKIGIKADLSVAIMDGGVFDDYNQALRENIELVKKYNKKNNLIGVRLGPCTPRLLTPQQFREIIEMAEELNVGIHTHVGEVYADLIHLARNYGMNFNDFIKFTRLGATKTLIAHAVWLKDSLDHLKKLNIDISHCPRSNTLLNDGLAPIRSMIHKGINVSLGIDVAPTYNILDDILSSVYLHYNRNDLTISELFNMVTVNAYSALGLGSGRIQLGEPADIIVWEGVTKSLLDPISAILTGHLRVKEAYVNGVLVYHDGSLVNISSIEINKALKIVNSSLRKIFEHLCF
jgi:5-methylthioadenosine/S-adenosylhomocysteine deaminase